MAEGEVFVMLIEAVAICRRWNVKRMTVVNSRHHESLT